MTGFEKWNCYGFPFCGTDTGTANIMKLSLEELELL